MLKHRVFIRSILFVSVLYSFCARGEVVYSGWVIKIQPDGTPRLEENKTFGETDASAMRDDESGGGSSITEKKSSDKASGDEDMEDESGSSTTELSRERPYGEVFKKFIVKQFLDGTVNITSPFNSKFLDLVNARREKEGKPTKFKKNPPESKNDDVVGKSSSVKRESSGEQPRPDKRSKSDGSGTGMAPAPASDGSGTGMAPAPASDGSGTGTAPTPASEGSGTEEIPAPVFQMPGCAVFIPNTIEKGASYPIYFAKKRTGEDGASTYTLNYTNNAHTERQLVTYLLYKAKAFVSTKSKARGEDEVAPGGEEDVTCLPKEEGKLPSGTFYIFTKSAPCYDCIQYYKRVADEFPNCKFKVYSATVAISVPTTDGRKFASVAELNQMLDIIYEKSTPLQRLLIKKEIGRGIKFLGDVWATCNDDNIVQASNFINKCLYSTVSIEKESLMESLQQKVEEAHVEDPEEKEKSRIVGALSAIIEQVENIKQVEAPAGIQETLKLGTTIERLKLAQKDASKIADGLKSVDDLNRKLQKLMKESKATSEEAKLSLSVILKAINKSKNQLPKSEQEREKRKSSLLKKALSKANALITKFTGLDEFKGKFPEVGDLTTREGCNTTLSRIIELLKKFTNEQLRNICIKLDVSDALLSADQKKSSSIGPVSMAIALVSGDSLSSSIQSEALSIASTYPLPSGIQSGILSIASAYPLPTTVKSKILSVLIGEKYKDTIIYEVLE